MNIIVGMSGGVDSSVAAALLKEQGAKVSGLFMRNWKETDQDGHCSAQADFFDVKSVAARLDIPYYSVDFSAQYWDRVFKLFLEEYEAGRTPNPDVLCNREIKFGTFREYAMGMGAEKIATGHYCDVESRDGMLFLKKAKDEAKDQTYFLNQVRASQLEGVVFPLGKLIKGEVRRIAAAYGFCTAQKKDSTGICFIGERKFRDFLKNYIPMKDGIIMTEDGRQVGTHSGVYYYTLGQRRGLGIGGDKEIKGGGRWFVVSKDVKNNILYVKNGDEKSLFNKQVYVEKLNFITERPKSNTFFVTARIRHGQPEQKATAELDQKGNALVTFDTPQRAATAGQYLVMYDGQICLGGGVITPCA